VLTGKVKWFNVQKGYGFITGPESVDYFVHYSGILGDGFKRLNDGAEVSFDAKKSEKGWLAVNVRQEPQHVV